MLKRGSEKYRELFEGFASFDTRMTNTTVWMSVVVSAKPMSEPTGRESAVSVIERELETLYRVARRMTLNEADAEDIVSQTMFAALKNWHSFDGRHTRSWLIKILKNEWLYLLRKRNSKPEAELGEGIDPSEEGYWEKIDGQIEYRQVVEALDTLPEDFRMAVTLCDLEELTYDEAADALGIPIGTVRSRVFRGRRILRAKLVHLFQEEQI